MNGSQVTVVVITIGSRDQKGLVTFRRRLASLTKKMTSGGPTSLKRTVPGLIFQINTLGGAISSDVEGAYPHRAFSHLGESRAYWESASHAAVLRAAIGRMRDHIAQAGVISHYANYPDLAFTDWPTAYYGAESCACLQQLKQRYDPGNRIRYLQSVQPPV
jgi:hypothetical protein